MPLLRGKPFKLKQTPENLKAEDEVFFFQLTGEVFTDYDEFFERVILCNSLLWSCECSGKHGLTYKEAVESEEQIRSSLNAIPDPTKRAILDLVHQTKRSRISDITEEIYDYLKTRYQDGETVEIKIKDQWNKCIIQKSYSNKSPSTPKSPKGKKATPNKSATKKSGISSPSSPLSPVDKHSGFWSKPLDSEYEIQLLNDGSSPNSIKVKGKQLRRIRGSLSKDLVRLFMRQTCKRTTPSSDDGFWVVEPHYVTRYALGESCVQVGPLSLETPLKFKQKRKRSSTQLEDGKTGKSPAKKRKSMESEKQSPGGKSSNEGKETKGKGKKTKKDTEDKKNSDKEDAKSPGKKTKFREKEMTPGQKKKILDKMKKKELAEKEKLKKKKLLQREKEKIKLKKEKEEEKQRKRLEREREREKTNVIRKMEVDFLKEWNRQKDDLNLEDLKELPETSKITSQIEGDLFGDVLMVVEFLNIFGNFYDIKDSVVQSITYELVEKALLEHDAEGVYYDIVKFLLQTFLSISKEENEEETGDGESTNGTNTPEEQEEQERIQEEEEEVKSGTVSSNAAAAAAWPMLHQGMALDELTIDPFTLSEILRLHVLSSGVKIGGARNLWQKRGGFQFTDDPCVDFRHKEKSVLTTLHTSCLYDLTTQDKLKVLCVLCNQILTLTTTRDYIEESFYKVKELKRRLRELQNKEQKRRKIQSAERWRKRMEECMKRREEIEKRKKEKEAREGETKNEKQTTEETSQTKKGRPKKTKVQSSQETSNEQSGASQSQESKEDYSQSQGSKEEQEADGMSEAFSKKEEQTAEELEEEKRIREEYRKEEKSLIDEIYNNAVVCSEVPIGMDRIYSRYWSLKYVDGLFVENDEQGQKLAEFAGEEKIDDDYDCTDDPARTEESNIGGDTNESKKTDFPQVTLNDIISFRNSEKQLCEQLFTRYKCEFDDERSKLISESKILSSILDAVNNGADPAFYADKPMLKWTACQNLQDLIAALNNRGLREDMLRNKLEKIKDKLENSIENCLLLRPVVTEAKPVRQRASKGDAIIDKSLFKTMDDFLEANLRDQLLDLEEKVWQGSLGVVKIENRESWRENVASQINLLLAGYSESNGESGSEYVAVDKLHNGATHNDGVEPDNVEKYIRDGSHVVIKDTTMNGSNQDDIKQESDEDMEVDAINKAENGQENKAGSLKTLPLQFIEQNGLKDEDSRCTTPVNVNTPMVHPKVKELARILLQIEHGIERKYLKPPLGEDEDTKKERIREMIEAAQTEFNGPSDNSKAGKRANKKEAANENESDDRENVTSLEDELKKERTCLERWESSLMAAANFSQVFIHLNTLDRSIMWDKSVLNAKCRLCRKKGDAEKMLLCDGCDRGFHMYCLKPPVKKIPDGDWFCIDCRPKEQRRGQRTKKRPTKLEEYVNTVDELSVVGEDFDDDFQVESEKHAESEDSESEDEESVDEHSDFCAACNIGGDLLCCDSCFRAFHTACIYPPIRKVPKGDWSCQVCTGADSDLPKARRVSTLEREREKMDTLLAKELSRQQAKQSTSGKAYPNKKEKKKEQRRGHSSPGPGPIKKQKTDKSADISKKQKTRNSVGDPTTYSSRRQSDAFGRYERRLCSKIIEELMTADDAEPFLLPVDVKVVPDYLNFIDNPMDLSTVKQNLNKGLYDGLDKFIQDVRLIFSNCETYNQPRSAVARAGSRLSIYFEQRLQELELVRT